MKAPASSDKKKGKGKSKGKDRKSKPSAKSGDVDFNEDTQADQEEPEDQADEQEDDPEAYLVEAQTSESEMESDGMLDWSASECKDYKDGDLLLLHVRLIQISRTSRLHMGMAGSLLSCKSTSTSLKVSLHSYMERNYLARPHSPASKDYPCQA